MANYQYCFEQAVAELQGIHMLVEGGMSILLLGSLCDLLEARHAGSLAIGKSTRACFRGATGMAETGGCRSALNRAVAEGLQYRSVVSVMGFQTSAFASINPKPPAMKRAAATQ